MANAFEQTVVKIVRRLIRQEYPYSGRAQVVKARITKVLPDGYNLVILDEELNRDENFPEIPKVKSTGTYKKGDIVVVTFVYGKDIYILGGSL
ncbi:MAG: hypothetical protein ACI4LO_01920 [Anaerovoracaceae bacterium]